MGQGRNETDLLPGLIDAHIAGGPARALGQIGQGETLVQTGAQIAEGPVLRRAFLDAAFAHRHDLDEGQIVALGRAPLHQRKQLDLGKAFQRHSIDLDAHAGGGGGADALQHRGQLAAPGQLRKPCGVQRVERDIHPPHPAGGQIGGMGRKLAAIGGQRQLVQGATVQVPGHGAEKRQDVAAHQGLAAGHAQLAHPQPDEGRSQPVQLFQRQQILARQEGRTLGHAIGAAEVAAVCHRNTQIADLPAKAVSQRGAAAGGNLGCGVKHGAGSFQ